MFSPKSLEEEYAVVEGLQAGDPKATALTPEALLEVKLDEEAVKVLLPVCSLPSTLTDHHSSCHCHQHHENPLCITTAATIIATPVTETETVTS